MSELTVKCPECDKQVPWNANSPFRPFCSERCRLIDLGEWADGKRVIPADAENDDVTAADLDRD
ncbi:MAG: DNA gyrase inhibitor YacG [bacterium]|nr:DNA gyrase inhibitor YacG [Gammaproteobacteria bacterium]HIL96808.1 DNA gyrase inhibitor YacG [Pseudomonadales bacterium]